MPLSSALRIFGVWSGSMAFAESGPVDVCLETIYAWTQALSCPPSCICLILTRAWFGTLFRVCLHACLPDCCLLFLPSRICASACCCLQPITGVWTVFPLRGDANRIQRRLESPCTCSYSLVRPGPVPEYRFNCLSACDTVLPYSL